MNEYPTDFECIPSMTPLSFRTFLYGQFVIIISMQTNEVDLILSVYF